MKKYKDGTGKARFRLFCGEFPFFDMSFFLFFVFRHKLFGPICRLLKNKEKVIKRRVKKCRVLENLFFRRKFLSEFMSFSPKNENSTKITP